MNDLSPGAAAARLRRPPDSHEYLGFSYERANQTGHALVKAAAETGNFLHLPEHLAALRDEMEHRYPPLRTKRLGRPDDFAASWS